MHFLFPAGAHGRPRATPRGFAYYDLGCSKARACVQGSGCRAGVHVGRGRAGLGQVITGKFWRVLVQVHGGTRAEHSTKVAVPSCACVPHVQASIPHLQLCTVRTALGRVSTATKRSVQPPTRPGTTPHRAGQQPCALLPRRPLGCTKVRWSWCEGVWGARPRSCACYFHRARSSDDGLLNGPVRWPPNLCCVLNP